MLWTVRARAGKQGCGVDSLDLDFQEGADSLPRPALPTLLRAKQTPVFPAARCLHFFHQATCQKARGETRILFARRIPVAGLFVCFHEGVKAPKNRGSWAF